MIDHGLIPLQNFLENIIRSRFQIHSEKSSDSLRFPVLGYVSIMPGKNLTCYRIRHQLINSFRFPTFFFIVFFQEIPRDVDRGASIHVRSEQKTILNRRNGHRTL